MPTDLIDLSTPVEKAFLVAVDRPLGEIHLFSTLRRQYPVRHRDHPTRRLEP